MLRPGSRSANEIAPPADFRITGSWQWLWVTGCGQGLLAAFRGVAFGNFNDAPSIMVPAASALTARNDEFHSFNNFPQKHRPGRTLAAQHGLRA